MKDMTFSLFVSTIEKIMVFREPWCIDDFHDSYVIFKEHVKYLWKPEFTKTMNSEECVIEWAKDFYLPAKSSTHDYWLNEKIINN